MNIVDLITIMWYEFLYRRDRIYNYKFINKKDVSKRSNDSANGKYITKLFFTYLLL